MNLKNVANFVNDNLTTIKCKFKNSNTDIAYTFVCTKEFASTLKVNDLVVAEVKDYYSIVQVVEIDSVSDIDVDKKFNYSWAFTKVDIEKLKEYKDEEDKVAKDLKQRQREKLKEQVINSLLEGSNKSLSIEEAPVSEVKTTKPKTRNVYVPKNYKAYDREDEFGLEE